jgi:hypothetical protein
MKPFDLQSMLLIALLNPAVIAVAFAMGRKADQWQKLPVAAMAASLAGVALAWVAAFARILPVQGDGAISGLFVFQFAFGLIWAAIAHRFFRASR